MPIVDGRGASDDCPEQCRQMLGAIECAVKIFLLPRVPKDLPLLRTTRPSWLRKLKHGAELCALSAIPRRASTAWAEPRSCEPARAEADRVEKKAAIAVEIGL